MSLWKRIYYGIPDLYLETLAATRVSFIAWISCLLVPGFAYCVLRVLTVSPGDPYLNKRVLISGMASVTHSLDSGTPENAAALQVAANLTTSQKLLGRCVVWIWTGGILLFLPTFYFWAKAVRAFMKERIKRPL